MNMKHSRAHWHLFSRRQVFNIFTFSVCEFNICHIFNMIHQNFSICTLHTHIVFECYWFLNNASYLLLALITIFIFSGSKEIKKRIHCSVLSQLTDSDLLARRHTHTVWQSLFRDLNGNGTKKQFQNVMFKHKLGSIFHLPVIKLMLIKLWLQLLLHIKMQILSCYVCKNVNMNISKLKYLILFSHSAKYKCWQKSNHISSIYLQKYMREW